MDYSQFITLSNHTNILSDNNSNNLSNFDRKIPKLDLKFEWKCGLHEISIPKLGIQFHLMKISKYYYMTKNHFIM